MVLADKGPLAGHVQRGDVDEHARSLNRPTQQGGEFKCAGFYFSGVVKCHRGRATDEFRARIPEQALGTLVENADREVRRGRDDGQIVGRIQHPTQQGRGALEVELRLLAGTDVEIDPDHADCHTRAIVLYLGGGLQVADVTARQHDPELRVKLSTVQSLVDFALGSPAVFGVQAGDPARIGLLAGGGSLAIKSVHLVVPAKHIAGKIPLPDADARGVGREGEALVRHTQFVRRPFAFRDVAKHNDGSHHIAALIPDRRHGILNGDFSAIPGDQESAHARSGAAVGRECLCHQFQSPLLRLGIEDVEHLCDRNPEALICRPPHQLSGDRVERLQSSLRIGRDDGIPDRLQGNAQEFMLIEQFPLRELASRDVLERPEDTDDRALFDLRLADCAHPYAASLGGRHLQFQVEGRPVGRASPARRFDDVARRLRIVANRFIEGG